MGQDALAACARGNARAKKARPGTFMPMTCQSGRAAGTLRSKPSWQKNAAPVPGCPGLSQAPGPYSLALALAASLTDFFLLAFAAPALNAAFSNTVSSFLIFGAL